MNRAEANDILTMHKLGLGKFNQGTVRAALLATGDLARMNKREPMQQVTVDQRPSGVIRTWRSGVAGGNSEVRL